jgi:hypothetical protein
MATERGCIELSKRSAISPRPGATVRKKRDVELTTLDCVRCCFRAQQLHIDPSVDTSSSPRVDLVHVAEQDEWCVTVNGERVLSFSGPSAWTKALSHRAELHDLLARDTADKRGDVER